MKTHIIKRPLVTEKSLQLANSQNVFTFEVDRLANKHQIAEAVAKIFSVEVLDVNTVRSNATTRSTGRKRLKSGVAPSKKALVQLKEGQTIEVFDLGGEA